MNKCTASNKVLIYGLIICCILAVLQLIILPLIMRKTFKQNKNIELFEIGFREIRKEPIIKTKMTYTMQPIINIYKDRLDTSNKLVKINSYHNNINVVDIDIIKKTNGYDLLQLEDPQNLLYTDAYTYSKYYKNYKILTLCSEPKHFLLISNTNRPLIEVNKSNNGRATWTIGYRNEVELDLFKKIVKSQKNYLNLDGFKFIELNSMSNDDIFKQLFNTKTIDLIIYLGNIETPFISEVRNHDYKLISYHDLDDNLLKYYIPFSKKHIQTYSRNKVNESENSDNTLLISNTLLIDTLICSLNNTSKISNDVKNIYKYILNFFNEFVKINYYMQYFEFIEYSKQWALKQQETASFNNIVSEDNKVPLIEKFIDNHKFMKFKISPRDLITVSNYHDLIKYKINKTLINGVPIKVGDKLYTDTGFGNFYKRTNYYVTKSNPHSMKYIEAESAIKVDISLDLYKSREIFNGFYYIKLTPQMIDNYKLEKSDLVFVSIIGVTSELDNINKIGEVIDKNIENDIALDKLRTDSGKKEYQKNKELNDITYNPNLIEDAKPDLMIRIKEESAPTNEFNRYDTRFDPSYRCYQDPTIPTRNECIDEVDASGNPKPIYNWDRPCNKDTECPFYLKNKNYLNNRGGCNNGYCELPVGVKRLSYREYDKNYTDNNYPRCYGCEDNDNINCCEKQGDNEKGPDYKYEGDQEDRRLSNFY